MADHNKKKTESDHPVSRLVGLLAQFDDPDSLIHAGTHAREAGYKKMDAFTPFPLHGIDEAIGIRRTWLPFFVLAIGLSACAFGLFLQYYSNAGDWSPIFPGYAFMISGKPLFSLPANIPVAFEITVLSSAFAAFFGMWALNRLPRLANPLHRISRFRRATNDRFFLLLEAGDEKYDSSRSRQQLEEWGATAIEECNEDLTDREFPKVLKMAGLILVFLLMIPPVLIFRASGGTSRAPRLHFMPDMDWQDKYKSQVLAPDFDDSVKHTGLFADGRAMRVPLPGTIALGKLENDTEYHRGFLPPQSSYTGELPVLGEKLAGQFNLQDEKPEGTAEGAAAVQEGAAAPQDPNAPPEPNWVTEFPANVPVSRELVERGRQRFEIYCSACHGYNGNGGGLINQHAMALAVNGQAAWTAAKSLHDPTITVQPVGRIFDTMTNGRNTMGPYKSQIPIADRWAIVLYVKALQETGITPAVIAPVEGAPETTPATKPAE